jgi:glyoxylase-like metal-dependent hydrolase (beta-lactamase superfamily II)
MLSSVVCRPRQRWRESDITVTAPTGLRVLYGDGVSWRELDDRVLVRRHESFDVNVGLVVGDGHCLVIDTREHLSAGQELAAAVRQVTAAPWTVVNTHAHFDHFMGNEAFLPGEIWSLDRTKDIIERYGEVQRQVMIHVAQQQQRADLVAGLEETSLTPPNRTFLPPATVLDIGGRQVTLRHLGRAHTDNDIMISVAGSDVLFAGDLVEEGAPPAFEDAYPIAWGPSLDGLLALVSGPVVPGHGDVVDAAFVREQRELHARVADAARGPATSVRGLPDEVATIALTRARAELAGTLALRTPQEVLAQFGLSWDR